MAAGHGSDVQDREDGGRAEHNIDRRRGAGSDGGHQGGWIGGRDHAEVTGCIEVVHVVGDGSVNYEGWNVEGGVVVKT